MLYREVVAGDKGAGYQWEFSGCRSPCPAPRLCSGLSLRPQHVGCGMGVPHPLRMDLLWADSLPPSGVLAQAL